MSVAVSPLMIRMLEMLLGYRQPTVLIDDARTDAESSYEAEYARRAGYRLGANGEWIALDPAPDATRTANGRRKRRAGRLER
jgi:hypothetical protein